MFTASQALVNAVTSTDLTHNWNDNDMDMPTASDSDRLTQRDRITSCSRCTCGCGCECVFDRNKGDLLLDLRGETVSGQLAGFAGMEKDGAEDNPSVDGDQGVAERMIQVGDFGLVSLRDIHMALARHQRCTCHSDVSSDGDDCPSSTGSGYMSQNSMIVRLGSGSDLSRVSSISHIASSYSGSMRSLSSTALGFVGANFEIDGMDVDVGHGLLYDSSLSIDDSATNTFSDYDMW